MHEELTVLKFGITQHEEIDLKMKKMQFDRISNKSGNKIIFVEHMDVVTVGPRAIKSGIVIPEGYTSRKVDRGGSITWHGPGQLIVYPIIHWNHDDEKSVKAIISKLENWVITAFRELGITGYRDERMMGVWVDEKKICSIGLSFMKWVSRHGLSININTPKGRVETLEGCGLSQNITTSLAAIGHKNITRELMENALLNNIENCLDRKISNVKNC